MTQHASVSVTLGERKGMVNESIASVSQLTGALELPRQALWCYSLAPRFHLGVYAAGSTGSMQEALGSSPLELPWAAELAAGWESIPLWAKLTGHSLFVAGLAPEFRVSWAVHLVVGAPRRARAPPPRQSLPRRRAAPTRPRAPPPKPSHS